MASLFLLRPSHLFRHASSRNKLSNSFSINIISRGHALWNSQRNLDEIDGEANTADITPPCASSSSQQGDDHNKKRSNQTNNLKPMVESLLGSTMSRAMSTLQNNQKNRIVDIGTKTAFVENVEGEGIGNTRAAALVDAAIDRANFQIKKEEVVRTGSSSSSPGCNTNISQDNVPPHEDKRTYLSNPAVTPTALAHSLWSQVVKPYQDTVIDATAGNGKDSLVLAKLLFPGSDECQQSAKKMNDLDSLKSSKLISIDIQKRACENTYQLLKENMGEEIMEKNCIQVLHTSHAPMPSLPTESVGLICYNLGYLPGTDDKEEFNTQMLTTIQSLADSALLIRPGGLLSVMSYPGNGWKEHCTVSYFMEGLAMFTTRDKKGGGWRGYLESIPSDRVLEQRHYDHYCTTTTTGDVECEVDESYGEEDNMTSSIRDAVKLALERVHSTGFQKQTWRVFEHKPLGRPLSPILFTGMRIK